LVTILTQTENLSVTKCDAIFLVTVNMGK